MLRALLIVVSLALATAALGVFDAATITRQALALGAAARDGETDSAKSQFAAQARAALAASPSRATQWHGGAIDALSWINAIDPDDHKAQSAADAVRGLQLAPIQAPAWTRLSALAAQGVENPLCDARACVARSWQAARMAEPEIACARLRAAQDAGVLGRIDSDERVGWYTRLVEAGAARACLDFAPGGEVFRMLVQRRADEIRAREARAQRR